MDKEFTCCICGKKFTGWGNNTWPVNKEVDARCCDDCNALYVIPARLNAIYKNKKEEN